MFVVLGLIAVIGLSTFLTLAVYIYTLRKNILDVPNMRSSHSKPTPRGGGLAFVLIFFFGIMILMFKNLIVFNTAIALLGGGLIVALIGWADDKKGLSSQLRLFYHFMAAAWALYWLGGFSYFDIGFMTLNLGWAGIILATIDIVWMINLYNFMDGIDGIAGTEAVVVASVAGVLLYFNGGKDLAILCAILACSVTGFLVWNWPPAKIFMGDVGSGFLGYIFAVLPIASEKNGSLSLIIWLILLGVFIVDATVTLIRRTSKGENWAEAHRTHVYQLAVQYGHKHKKVTIAVLCINLFLGIIAFAALKWHESILFFAIGTMFILVLEYVILYRKYSTKGHISKHDIVLNNMERSLAEAAVNYDEWNAPIIEHSKEKNDKLE